MACLLTPVMNFQQRYFRPSDSTCSAVCRYIFVTSTIYHLSNSIWQSCTYPFKLKQISPMVILHVFYTNGHARIRQCHAGIYKHVVQQAGMIETSCSHVITVALNLFNLLYILLVDKNLCKNTSIQLLAAMLLNLFAGSKTSAQQFDALRCSHFSKYIVYSIFV